MSQVSSDTESKGPEGQEVQLERSTYEVIRNRLEGHGADLKDRLSKLNDARRDVFGSIETKLVNNQRITTDNNCIPRDIVPIGDRFVFGYNVHLGLRSETNLEDVFAVHRFDGTEFHIEPLDLISESRFVEDFRQLYKYYKHTQFSKFQVIGPHLFMVFQVGKSTGDIKSFKWLIGDDQLTYVDNRSDHEVTFPSQHEYSWVRTHRDLHRSGLHPHISIDDRVFVETVGGDLTVKIEDNTEEGEGIYSEPVEDPDQTLDDAEIFYASVGNIILMKVRPYKEKNFRYLVFNEKTQTANRLDAIEDACVLLPEDHGLIFSNGYYLQTGEYKTFDNQISNLMFEKRISSPNGEDHLYVFYNRESGDYVLLSYNMIAQKVETPILCNGFSFFENGQLVLFRCDESPQKFHALQIWQTPFVGQDFQTNADQSSYLFKIGNRDVVRAMAECYEILGLLGKEDSYANLYVDLVRKTSDVIDAYFWLNEESAFSLGETLGLIHAAASSAVDEFDKVVRVRRNTKEQTERVAKQSREILSSAASRMYQQIEDFVQSLGALRQVRGEVISLKDLKYADLASIDQLEGEIQEATDRISKRCVDFLLRDDALVPYQTQVDEQRASIDHLEKASAAKQLEKSFGDSASELEMLIEIVSNLKIDDATQRTRIIDSISGIYSTLNQARATLKKKAKELASVEGVAEFSSQMKLLSQAVVNYLDVCDSAERCDEYLTKMMVQVEELEGRFAEFDEFVIQLTEKREEIYAAFDSRRMALVEARNKRANALMSAADRILKGVRSRVSNFDSINEINSYFASDLMIDKVRDIVQQLTELEDSVKVDDIQSRLKAIREDTVRQLKDRQELFVDGENVIRFGRHKFSVNVQSLELTSILKEQSQYFHLAGTKFLEKIEDPRLQATVDVWDQEVVSEDPNVYRGEYLSYLLYKNTMEGGAGSRKSFLDLSAEERVAHVQKFMANRYSDGYVKGVHDHDAALITSQLLEMEGQIGSLRYPPTARALARLFWMQCSSAGRLQYWLARIRGIGVVRKLFPEGQSNHEYVELLAGELNQFLETTPWGSHELLAADAAGFLFDELAEKDDLAISQQAYALVTAFSSQLDRRDQRGSYDAMMKSFAGDLDGQFKMARLWVASYVEEHKDQGDRAYVDEAAAFLLGTPEVQPQVLTGHVLADIEGLVGHHSNVEGEFYSLDYHDFFKRLRYFEQTTVPAFESYVELKKVLLEEKKNDLRLDEFRPRVLTSFVRNRLIDEVYLPLIGDNLAKQMGVVGEDKRTDLMGLLLLISPPGYGKTTLMEYVANRLGITFMKINGPAIGHHVTSLDPQEAPNASAREEVEKLNLALEMGDNVMIYLDDIQHCNPEFLQKFISLCDGSRRIEGVYRGVTRTYDLRGRKVCVVMAGNPYTESGAKFQIPDMLANRADTYNLGDVVGENSKSFDLSYLENCLTSNKTLQVLQSRSKADIHGFVKMAEDEKAQGVDLEGNYSIEEINEIVGVFRKLLFARDVLLKVNAQYIASAAQADEYRTEPPFKLQGSYRDMNKIAERVVAIMNEEELNELLMTHFENQAQTLTTGAEANLLKFKDMMDWLDDEETERWNDIKRTYKRNLLLGGTNADDKMGQVIAQMTTFSEGLYDIRKALETGVSKLRDPKPADVDLSSALDPAALSASHLADAVQVLGDLGQRLGGIEKVLSEPKPLQLEASSTTDSADASSSHLADAVQALGNLGQRLEGIEKVLSEPKTEAASDSAGVESDSSPQRVEVVTKVPKQFLDVIKAQFAVLQTWFEPLYKLTEMRGQEVDSLREAIEESRERYENLLKRIDRDTRR